MRILVQNGIEIGSRCFQVAKGQMDRTAGLSDNQILRQQRQQVISIHARVCQSAQTLVQNSPIEPRLVQAGCRPQRLPIMIEGARHITL